jgi:hypothetical protein
MGAFWCSSLAPLRQEEADVMTDVNPEVAQEAELGGLIALVVSKTYGVKLRADDKSNPEIFRSLRSLNRYIRQNQTK